MNLDILKKTAAELLVSGKGILAADESRSTCAKRFETAGVPCTEESRRVYREFLFTTPGIEEFLSGVILYDETIRQNAADGTPLPRVLAQRGIVPGIKVDAGAKDLALHPGEKVTEGLDGLRERLAEYKTLGARFAKWRAVITIDGDAPSGACVHANAHALARYAALCQEIDVLPIIEPEVLIDGDHSIDRCDDVTRDTLRMVFEELEEQDISLEGIILKASMVLSGKESATHAGVDQVAQKTVARLVSDVPANLAGVVFLSGGQSDERATAHLNAMNKIGGAPWRLTFSYSRAIQNPVLKLWAAKQEDKAREAYLFRARMNSLASQGRYDEAMEKERPY